MNLPAHYFGADLHLGHHNILKLDGRPWSGINLHDLALTQRMRPLDKDKNRSPQLWLLGDVGTRAEDIRLFMRDIRPYWWKIHLIRGNHDDKAAWKLRDLFDTYNESLYVRVSADVKLYLSHYAHRVWRGSNRGTYHLHGHSHGALPRVGRSMDVGVMLHDYRPVPLTRVVAELEGNSLIDHHETE